MPSRRTNRVNAEERRRADMPADGDAPTDADDAHGSGEEADLGLDDFHSEPLDQGLSLEDLSQTFAKLISAGEEPYDSADDESGASPEDLPGTPPAREANDVSPDEPDACPVTPRSIVEAILFVGHPHNEPLTAEFVSSLMRGVRAEEVDDLVRELNAEYEAGSAPYEIASAGAGYRMQLRDQYGALRNKFYGRVREARLSQAAVEVLAVVAYRQGITTEELDEQRGKPSGSLLNQLVRRQLVRFVRTETKPRRRQYFTTDRFLQLFNLASLDELPRSQDIERGE